MVNLDAATPIVVSLSRGEASRVTPAGVTAVVNGHPLVIKVLDQIILGHSSRFVSLKERRLGFS
jgi:hypothetical protein